MSNTIPVQTKPKRVVRFGILAMTLITLIATLVSANTLVADAAGGYSISSGTWNVRSCPATCGALGTVTGSLPDLVCQTGGPAVTVQGFGTSTIYDLVRMPSGQLGYISDLGVLQTLYAQFTPGLPRCTAGAGPATEAASNWGYGWVAWCSAKVYMGKLWACWQRSIVQLFLPDPAS